jgi:uncharacterized protein
MSLLALNLFWGAIDLLCLVALARGVRPATALGLSLLTAALAFFVENGPSPVRFHAMRAAAFALFLHLPVVLVGLAWLWRRNRRWMACALVALALVAVAGDAFLYEPHALVTSHYEVKSGTRVRIAVMSDFQAAQIGEYERSILVRIAALDPELVLLAGDYIQVSGEARASVVREFREAWRAAGIHPRLGVFAVRGDVEPDGWEAELFAGLDVVTSDQTRTFRAGDLTVTLLGLRDSGDRHLALPSTPTSIVLGHRPDFALGKGPAGLLVAGHTHGGQVQVPFFGPPLILSAVPRRWGAGGLHVVDEQRTLLVTRGAGVEHADDAPPLRFDCRPEIVALDLVP